MSSSSRAYDDILHRIEISDETRALQIIEENWDEIGEEHQIKLIKISIHNDMPAILEYVLEKLDNGYMLEFETYECSNIYLIDALECDSLKVAQWLLNIDADPTFMEGDAFRIACQKGYTDIVKNMLGCYNIFDVIHPDETCPMFDASENLHFDIVDLILDDERFRITEYDNFLTIFFAQIACTGGHYYIIKKLIESGKVKPSFDDNYGIGYASKYGHIDIVELLLKYDDVNPSANDEYALRQSCKNDHIDVVRRLLKDKRVNPKNGKQGYAIDEARGNSNDEIVDLLLANDEELYDF